MIVTEEEAKTKRCQESFAPPLTPTGHAYPSTSMEALSFHAGGSYHAVQSSPSMCIGSACMAWRWLDQVSYVEGNDEPRKSSLGYCGKAGRP